MSQGLNAVIEAEIERLRSMPIVELRALWRAKFKTDPPKAFGPDLLRRSIASRRMPMADSIAQPRGSSKG